MKGKIFGLMRDFYKGVDKGYFALGDKIEEEIDTIVEGYMEEEKKVEENIFELLEEWDYALFDEDKEKEREVGKKINALRKEYREKGNMPEKVKVVGVFDGNLWSIYANDEHFGTIFNLKYSGRANSRTDRRLYTNQDTYIWLDYAVYE